MLIELTIGKRAFYGNATYNTDTNETIVKKGTRINRTIAKSGNSEYVKKIREEHKTAIKSDYTLNDDIVFTASKKNDTSLSRSAYFITGDTAYGISSWNIIGSDTDLKVLLENIGAIKINYSTNNKNPSFGYVTTNVSSFELEG